MRIWKTQSKVAACNLTGKTVAVRVWDSFDHTYTYDIVRVAEVSPNGDEFAAFKDLQLRQPPMGQELSGRVQGRRGKSDLDLLWGQ